MTIAAKGFVSFVSSGPGDPELLTLKAVDRLKTADAVLFDDLASGPILDYAAKGADLVSVGKRAGRVSPKQSQVSQLLVEYAQTGRRVVRLKSGDSGIFGRLEEELVAVRDAGIPFEIVPGVTSPSAAAAIAGIPLTRRLTSRRIQFVTGADITGDLPRSLNMAALADANATTVIFMGRRTFPKLAAELISHGLPADTPAMIAEAVGHPEQRFVTGDLASIARLLAEEPGTGPVLVFYGPLATPGAGLVIDTP